MTNTSPLGYHNWNRMIDQVDKKSLVGSIKLGIKLFIVVSSICLPIKLMFF